MNENPNEVLSMILDIWKIYIKYVNQANKAYNQYDQIWVDILELKQDLYLSNEEKEQIVTLFQKQAKKLKQYEKMIDIL